MRPSFFVWGVSPVCFQNPDTQDAIIPRGESGRSAYAPLDVHTGLFMTFSELGDDPDNMLAFAGKYGMLFNNGEPESIDTWRNHVANMKLAVDRWQSNKDNNKLLTTIEHWLEVRAEFLRDNREIVLAPPNLFTAMWLQFGLAVSESKLFRRCTWCEKPFHVKGKQIKAERVFCSGSCKAHDYRYRKEHATKKTG